jgi:tetratricopeptide (TPR) repeat protein
LLNLGEMYLATGDLRKSRQLVMEGLQEISFTQDVRGKVYALNNLGRVLLGMGDVPGAARRYNEAHEFALNHKLPTLVCESTAGLAACAIQQGQLDEARKYANETWDYLKEHGWLGMDKPAPVYRSCAETFEALGDMENFKTVIESAHQLLMEAVDTINVPEWRHSFLENVPDHRAIMEMWERRKL